MRNQNTRKALGVGHLGTREIKEYDRQALDDIKLCPYTTECNRRCIDDTNCRVRRFYDRYPNYKELNIGSKL
jgi:hypothetical protein